MTASVRVTAMPFGTLPDGRVVTRWDIRGGDGAGIVVMDYGATILAVDVPDRDGVLAGVVLGFDTLAPYLEQSAYIGTTVGRFANRIAGARFALDGATYRLAANNGTHALHGGTAGFDKRLWNGAPVETVEGAGVRLMLVSPDGDEGYPGEVQVTATYIWTADHRLIVEYAGTTTRPTPFSLAQHSYWNLAGAASGATILSHELCVNAHAFLPVDDALIPLGAARAVAGTPFDFRTKKPVGRDIDGPDDQLARGGGYDHNMVLGGHGLREAAMLRDPASGRVLRIATDLPGLQIYSGNFLNMPAPGKGGARYGRRSGIALETQHFPDAPNRADFPDCILRPDTARRDRTVYTFGVEA